MKALLPQLFGDHRGREVAGHADQASCPRAERTEAHEVKVLALVTQQLASSALVQAWVYTPCSFYHTNVFWLESGQSHFIRTPATQWQVNLPAQVSVLSFGPRGLNYLKSHHSTVKARDKRMFPATNISFLQLCQCLYSKTMNNKPTDPTCYVKN